MYAIDLVLNDGRKLEALIWTWRPAEGWLEVLDESNGKIKKLKLSNIREGRFYSDRIRKLSKSEDFIERAKSDGWST